MLKTIRSHFGLFRSNIETPFFQSQKTKDKKNLGVRPSSSRVPPVPSKPTDMAPRQPLPTTPTRASAPSLAAPISPAIPAPNKARPAPEHTTAPTQVDGLGQTGPDFQALVEQEFDRAPQALMAKTLLQQALRDWTPPPSCAPPGSAHALLTDALAKTTGADASLATAALAALRTLDPLRDVTTAWRQRAHAGTARKPESAAAWRLAAELATRPNGMDVLQALLPQRISTRHEKNFILLLKAGAASTASRTTAGSACLLDDPAVQDPTLDFAALSVEDWALRCAMARLAGDEAEAHQARHTAPTKFHRAAPKWQPALSPLSPISEANESVPPNPPTHALIDVLAQPLPDLRWLVEHQFGQAPLRSKVLLQKALHNWTPPPACIPPGMPGMPHVLLTQALAAATGTDASLATTALATLQTLDPLRDLTAAWQQRGQAGAAVEPATAAAWRVAMELATTPSGMDLLQALLTRPIDAQHKKDFFLLLKAGAAASAAPGTLAAPDFLLNDPAVQATVAGQAVHCAMARLAGEPDAGHAHDWALNAVRNDLYDIGPGSDFEVLEARIQKMGSWIDRATDDPKFSIRNPLKGKSAFRALRHGVQHVDRGTALGRHRVAYERALRQATTDLSTQLVALAATSRSERFDLAPNALVRAAVLAHCAELNADHSMDRYRFDSKNALTDITKRLADMVGMQGRDSAPLLSQVRKLARRPMNLERVERWLTEAETQSTPRKKKEEHPPASSHNEQVSWKEPIHAHLTKARQEAYGNDTQVPHVTREKIQESLEHIVDNIEGSSRLRLTSGGIVGVGTKQVSATVSSVAGAMFMRGRVDAKKQWGRQAVFEIAMPPYDMEILIGTQNQHAAQLGIGGTLGPSLGVMKFNVASVDGLIYGRESSGLTGVSLRLPRIGRPVSELRAEFTTLVDRLMAGTAPTTNRREPLLKSLLQEFPQLTINRIGSAGDGRIRHGVTADVGASVSGPFIRASATVGSSVEKHRAITKHYSDATGSLRVDRQINGHGVRGSVGFRVAAGLTVDVGRVALSASNTDVTVVGGSADLLVGGSADRREVVYQDGRVHTISFTETEYQNVDTFRASMKSRLDDWAHARVAAPHTERDFETEKARVQGFLNQIHQQATPTHSFAARYTLKAHAAAQIDAYRSAAMLAARHPGGQHLADKDLDQAVEAIWNNPDSVYPYSLRAYDRSTQQDSTGLNLVLQLATLNIADAAHIDNRFDVA